MSEPYRIEYNPPLTLRNIIIWFDGTIRPWRGHNNCNCRWNFDGQIYSHLAPSLTKDKTLKETNKGG
jgi:hypothetical protein